MRMQSSLWEDPVREHLSAFKSGTSSNAAGVRACQYCQTSTDRLDSPKYQSALSEAASAVFWGKFNGIFSAVGCLVMAALAFFYGYVIFGVVFVVTSPIPVFCYCSTGRNQAKTILKNAERAVTPAA